MVVASTFWNRAEDLFRQNNYDGSPIRGTCVKARKSSSVCLVSVHGINHYLGRDDTDRKLADLNTGGLVRAIAYCAGVNSIFNCSRRPEINPHRGETAADRLLRELIASRRLKIVLDIHGAKDRRDFDVAIGTGGQPMLPRQGKYVDMIVSDLTKAGYTVVLNHRSYTGGNSRTIVSRHRDAIGVCILQIEIVRRLRDPLNSTGQSFFAALHSIVNRLNSGAAC